MSIQIIIITEGTWDVMSSVMAILVLRVRIIKYNLIVPTVDPDIPVRISLIEKAVPSVYKDQKVMHSEKCHLMISKSGKTPHPVSQS